MALFLCSGIGFQTIVRVIRSACALQRAEVAGDLTDEAALSIDDIVVCTIGMIQNGKLLTVAMLDLVQEQVAILHIRLCGNVVFKDRRIRNRDHVVEAEKTEASTVKLQDVLAGL